MPEDTQDGSRKIKWGMVKAAAACGDWLDVRKNEGRLERGPWLCLGRTS